MKEKNLGYPHSKFLVCDSNIDQVVRYVFSKDLLNCVLGNQTLLFNGAIQILLVSMLPNRQMLFETLDLFKSAGEDFETIVNKYALMVGMITLNDVITTLMDGLVGHAKEEKIVKRN